jgi:TM2 domain-containing membrane protein YozV
MKDLQVQSDKERFVYIILAVFAGFFGVHNFYIGNKLKGYAQLFITIFIGWLILPLFITWIWSFIEILKTTHDSEGRKLV